MLLKGLFPMLEAKFRHKQNLAELFRIDLKSRNNQLYKVVLVTTNS